MLNSKIQKKTVQGGFLLIEVLVSLLIFSIGLLALIGMQNFSINDTVHGKYRTDASYLANSIIGQMMVDKNNIASYAGGGTSTKRDAWKTQVRSALPNGDATINVDSTGIAFTIVITWYNPNEDPNKPHNYTTVAQVAF